MDSKIKEYQGTAARFKKDRDLYAIYMGIAYQLKSLKNLLLAPPETVSVKVAFVPQKSYSFQDYEENIGIYISIKRQLEELKQQKEFLEGEIDGLEGEVKDLTGNLLQQKQKSRDFYMALAQLVSTQVKLAKRKVKLSRLKKKEEILSELLEQEEEALDNIFKNLKITKKDIELLKRDLEKAEREFQQLKESTKQDKIRINKTAASIAWNLERITSKIPKVKNPESLILQKQRYEAILESLDVQRSIEDERLRGKELSLRKLRFRLEWAKCVNKNCPKKESKNLLIKWNEFKEQISSYIERCNAELDNVKNSSQLVLNKIISVQQQSSKTKLINSYKKLHDKLNELIFILQQNKSHAEESLIYVGKTLEFLRKKAGIFAKVPAWIETERKSAVLKLKKVLFFPIAKVGESPLTPFSIIRFLFIIAVGVFISKKISSRISRFLIHRTSMPHGTADSIATLSHYFMMLVAFGAALSSLGISLKQITFVVGALGVGIGFGLQTIINNFVSGIILLSEQSIRVGDIVELEDGALGEVRKINMRATVIRTFDGMDIIVPNSELISGRVTTWTYQDDWRRLKIPFGVAYGTDPYRVKEVAQEAAREVPYTREDAEHPVEVWLEGFGDSSVNYALVVWVRMYHTPHNKKRKGLVSDYYLTLYKKLYEAGIEIPYPQMDIHVRSVYPEVWEIWKGSRGQ